MAVVVGVDLIGSIAVALEFQTGRWISVSRAMYSPLCAFSTAMATAEAGGADGGVAAGGGPIFQMLI